MEKDKPLICAGCGEVFVNHPITIQDMIVVREKDGIKVFVHLEPCSLAYR